MSVDEKRIIGHSTASLHQPRVTVLQLFHRAMVRMQKNRAARALYRLDDWYLEDMGIQRGEIPRVVEALFEKDDNGGPSPVATRSRRMEISNVVRDIVDAIFPRGTTSGRHG